MADIFLRYPLGTRWRSDVYAVLLEGQPLNLAEGGWTVRAEAGVSPDVRVWTTTPGATGRVVLGTAEVVAGDTTVTTSTVQLEHLPEFTEGWAPFVADFEVVIAKAAGGAGSDRRVVLSGFMRGDTRATDDSPAGAPLAGSST